MGQELRIAYRPRAWQLECHRQKRRFSVFALHRRAGKTELAIMELIDKALKCRADLGMFLYVAPYRGQAKAIAWARLKQKLRPLVATGGCELNESELTVTFRHNGAAIRLFGGDNPDAMRGLHCDGLVIDEVAQIKPNLWTEITQPALSDRLGWAVFIGTPDGVNLFSELYFHASAQTDGTWHAARYTVYDTQSIIPGEVERLRRDMSEASFAREYLCDFSASGDDQLISLTDATAAALRQYTQGDVRGMPVVMGVDPARFGNDRSVIMRRQGLQAFDPLIYRGIDNMELAARVAGAIEEHSPDAVFIDAGAGAGVIDRLRQLGHDVIEVPFGSRAFAPHQFVNRRTEMWFAVRDWLRSGGAVPDDRALKQELATPTFWFDAAGRKVLESKDEIKKRLQGAGSPDIADALALTFATPVAASVNASWAIGSATAARVREYDPYAASNAR